MSHFLTILIQIDWDNLAQQCGLKDADEARSTFTSLSDFEQQFDDNSATDDRIEPAVLHRNYCHKPDCEYVRFYDGEAGDADIFIDRYCGYCYQPGCEVATGEGGTGGLGETEKTYVERDSYDTDEA